MIALTLYIFCTSFMAFITTMVSPNEKIDLLIHYIKWALFPLYFLMAIYVAKEFNRTKTEMIKEATNELFLNY